MKKILLATSVLAATTGFAAAEVTVSGSARMGVAYSSITGDTLFSSRVRVSFSMVGTTDGGLEFGASVRNDQDGGNGSDAGGTESGTNNGDSTVYIAMNGLKLTMGDVGGAADALVGQVSGVGYGPNDSLQEIGFVGQDKTAVYAEYTTGALTFGLGAGQTNGSGDITVAVKYATDAFTVALGYEDSGNGNEAIHVAGSGTFGAVTVKARITDASSDFTITDPNGVIVGNTPYALSVDYKAGATTVTAFYSDFDNGNEHIGIGGAYDLGGGASVKGGIVRSTGLSETFADVGIVMSF